MKRSIFRLFSSAIILAMLVTVVGCTTAKPKITEVKETPVPAKTTIVMGTEAGFPPFEFHGDSGKIEGFDVEIANNIAVTLNAELKIEDMGFDSLLAALETGKVDFVSAGMTVTEERKKSVDFSDTYYKSSQVIMVRSSDTTIKAKNDLKGKTIGVQEGTVGDLVASDEFKDKEPKRYKKYVDAIMDLKNKKIDAIVLDAIPAASLQKMNPTDVKVLEEKLTEEDYAIAVKKGNTELLTKINATLKAIKENGKYDELIKKYIDEK